MKTSQKPFRIGLDARLYRKAHAGIGRYTRELIHHLAKIDRTNEYYVFLTAADLAEWDVHQDNFIPVMVTATHYTLAEQTSFLRTLYSYKLDLVHFLNFNHPILYKKPFVTTLHDLTLYFYPAGRSKTSAIRKKLFDTVFRHAMNAAQKVIAISHYTATDAHKHLHLSDKKIVTIYEGGPDAQPITQDKQLIEQFLHTSDPYFLFVSQWRPHKGIITLIDAYDMFKKTTGLKHKLVLTGRQDQAEAHIKTRLEASPYKADIITPGFAPEDVLPQLYHNATALIVPSEYEGFGLPPLEGFAYETPVIAADNSSLTEVVGAGGLLFETRNAIALAHHLQTIATDTKLASELVAKGKKQLQKFSWDLCARQTHAVYTDLLEKR